MKIIQYYCIQYYSIVSLMVGGHRSLGVLPAEAAPGHLRCGRVLGALLCLMPDGTAFWDHCTGYAGPKEPQKNRKILEKFKQKHAVTGVGHSGVGCILFRSECSDPFFFRVVLLCFPTPWLALN